MALYTNNPSPTNTPESLGPAPPGGPSRRSYRIAVVIAVVVLAAVIAGGVVLLHHNKDTGAAAKTTTGGPATTNTTPTTESLSSVVLSAYLSDQLAWETVLATYPVDPTDRRLPEALTGEELSAVRNHLTGNRLQGQVGVGVDRISRKPTVSELTETMARITDCVTDHSDVISQATKAVVSAGSGGPYPWTATLILTGGTWKIATYVQGGTAC